MARQRRSPFKVSESVSVIERDRQRLAAALTEAKSVISDLQDQLSESEENLEEYRNRLAAEEGG